MLKTAVLSVFFAMLLILFYQSANDVPESDWHDKTWLLIATDIFRYDGTQCRNFTNVEQMTEFNKTAFMVSQFVTKHVIATKLSSYRQAGWNSPMNDTFFTWVAFYNVTPTALFDMESRNVSAIVASLSILPRHMLSSAHIIWITDAASSCREYDAIHGLAQSGVTVYVVLTGVSYGSCFVDMPTQGIHVITIIHLVKFVDPLLRVGDEHIKMRAEWSYSTKPHMAAHLFNEYMHYHMIASGRQQLYYLTKRLFDHFHYPVAVTKLC